MNKRKETPPLMDDLLTGKKTPAAAMPPPSPVTPPPAPSRNGEEKIKVTFYLAQEVADELEQARLTLIRLLRPDSKHDVSKSVIAEQAIRLAVSELQATGLASALARALE